MTKLGRWASLTAALVAAMGGPLLGFQTTSDFVPMTQAPQDTIAGGTLVIAAYAFAWVAVTVYVLVLWRRTQRIERELADVRDKLTAIRR